MPSTSGVDATVGTHTGPVRSAWNRIQSRSLYMVSTSVFRHSVGIPVGAIAEVHVLTYDWGKQSVTVQESGRTVWSNGKFQPGQTGVTSGIAGKGEMVFSVGSGVYEFQVMVPEF